ncbi:cysteine-rich receptor-like protein kinase 3 [Euphorbia lathyris]|uniref:cysteine-rich receptor-like protein kinase 3 n=1 Tax=Euphorbia lathyris TaxID=212925 RepID=UPI0033133605
MVTLHPYRHEYFLISLLSCLCLAKSDPRTTGQSLVCTNRTAAIPVRQEFVANFLATMDLMSPLIDRQQFGSAINGTGNLTVYTFGECMKDLDQTDCNLCFAQCKTQILKCLPFQRGTRGGRINFDGCYLRYDDYNFFNERLSSQDKTVCEIGDFSGGNKTLFSSNAMELARNLSVEAPKNDGFFVGSVAKENVTVYGLAQCWELVNRSNCEVCLGNAVAKIANCSSNEEEGRVLNAGCYLRFSTQKFYDNSSSNATRDDGGSSHLAVILAVTSSSVAVVLIVTTVVFFVRKRLQVKKRERKELGALLSVVNNSKLNFTYETLERATNYFHLSNKLGEGGSGSVYKGTLPDGKVVAVKRLLFNTRQWVDHFFNEVNLISDIQHKNLVKLLGCSITGPESLLVYEFVPNQSLHDYLFGSNANNVSPLSWEMRFNIIFGTAEGLTYLHEESKLRIIHRDIKLSNILLELDFSPKIADFGLARLFPEDKTHITTVIAGTLGYMAPEYIVRGKLTEKADVYSFGVVLIEVVTGKRNNAFVQNSSSVLQMVWNLYGTGRLCEAVDTALDGNYRQEEASRMLQIGLLCVQASAELRPAMSIVVKMLENNHEIMEPTQPPFLNANNSSPEFNLNVKPSSSSSQPDSYTQSSGNSMTQSWIEPR